MSEEEGDNRIEIDSSIYFYRGVSICTFTDVSVNIHLDRIDLDIWRSR